MSKLIAVWGAPGAGKTTFALKLAHEIYKNNSASKVICVLADSITPALPVAFPNKKETELYSIGSMFSKPDFNANDVLSRFVLAKGIKNVVFMGYKYGENKYTFPEYSEEKANRFLDIAKYLAEYVIVDCTCELADRLSYFAMLKADTVFRINAPSLKTLSFMASNIPIYSEAKYRFADHISVMNVNEQDIYMPVDDVISCLGNVKYTVPYSVDIKKQYNNGELLELAGSKSYLNVMSKIYNEVLSDGQQQ